MKHQTKKAVLDRSLIHLLHRAGQCAQNIFANEISSGGLTPRQYAVLLTISKNDGISQTGIFTQTGIDRSTLADIMRRMQKKGFIKRRRTKDDARTDSVGLTARGRKLIEKAKSGAQNADKRLLAALPVKERKFLLAALEKMIEKSTSK